MEACCVARACSVELFAKNLKYETLSYWKFMKIAPLMAAFSDHQSFKLVRVHTGQDYVTLHRPANVDDDRILAKIISDLAIISDDFTCGTNRLAGTRKESILRAWRESRDSSKTGLIPPLWDGLAGLHCHQAIANFIVTRGADQSPHT